MKYLITGINGQLGHDLYKILNDGKNEVFAPTSLTLNLTDPVTIYKSVLESYHRKIQRSSRARREGLFRTVR